MSDYYVYRCKYFGPDGVCEYYTDDEVTEYCVEGPCLHEVYDEGEEAYKEHLDIYG